MENLFTRPGLQHLFTRSRCFSGAWQTGPGRTRCGSSTPHRLVIGSCMRKRTENMKPGELPRLALLVSFVTWWGFALRACTAEVGSRQSPHINQYSASWCNMMGRVMIPLARLTLQLWLSRPVCARVCCSETLDRLFCLAGVPLLRNGSAFALLKGAWAGLYGDVDCSTCTSKVQQSFT